VTLSPVPAIGGALLAVLPENSKVRVLAYARDVLLKL
jgi:hypothetical protein